ncbi:MAG TPA: hypothetical protein VK184_12800 [Nostocaceae cyanobacterium]|nr:hypothetical protein [Nostocaceae cyanobacterium]
MQLEIERWESLKAGIIGGFSVGLAFLGTFLVNTLINMYFPIHLLRELTNIDFYFFFDGAIAGFCGLLFGVTYRYIIRLDQNRQLKAGAVLAFGLVRGLTQIEIGWNLANTILPFLILAGESIFWFAGAAVILDTAISRGWVKPFSF